MLYGWYSAQQRDTCGSSCIYLTPRGEEVEVTMVSHEMEQDSYWEDILPVGEVASWVRRLVDPFQALIEAEEDRYWDEAYERDCAYDDYDFYDE